MQLWCLFVVNVVSLQLFATADWFDSCDSQYQLTSNADVTLNSPLYPYKYPTGTSCRYILQAPTDYVIRATCIVNIDKPESVCSSDFLYISTDRIKSLIGSEYFCGDGTIVRQSVFNKMMLAYISTTNNYGGSFSCRLQVQPAACDCGWSKTAKIVGGTTAGVNEYTSLVGLIDTYSRDIFCSGVIISTRYVITAAHCAQDIPSVDQVIIVVGEHDYDNDQDTPYTATYHIEDIIIHENYIRQSRDNDIALLRTTQDIDFNRGVGPTCLPYNYRHYDFNGLQVDLTGWGTTSFGGPLSTILQKTTLNVLSNDNCLAPYVNDFKMCVFASGRDSCQYDSGGPVYLRGVQRMYTIGIISYGSDCAGTTPSVNTRITAYLNWIQVNTPNTNYCIK